MTTGKTIALTRRFFIGKVMSPLFNMLSRLVIAFLPRSKCLLISWLQSPSAVILEPPKIVSHCFHCFPLFPTCNPACREFFNGQGLFFIHLHTWVYSKAREWAVHLPELLFYRWSNEGGFESWGKGQPPVNSGLWNLCRIHLPADSLRIQEDVSVLTQLSFW